jgi:hypothetical protein
MSETRKQVRLLMVVLAGLLMVGSLVGGLAARPEAAGNENIKVIQVWDEEVLEADVAAGDSFSWLSNSSGYGFSDADVFYTIDVGTEVNTTTLELEVSPDDSLWINHAASNVVANAVAADGSSYVAAAVDGRYFRINANVANTSPVTISLWAVLH